MITPIRGKVAHILNTREIAINVGTENGVTVGMYFDVMDAHYENITDPDTNEVLGSLERPKVRVKIIHVQEKLSLATTYRKERVEYWWHRAGDPPWTIRSLSYATHLGREV